MAIAMPNTPERLAYAMTAATAITGLLGLVMALGGVSRLVGLVLLLAFAGAVWRVGQSRVAIVTATDATGAIAVLFVLCALADLLTGYPYQAVLFLLAAAALGFAFLLLQQGTEPGALRLGGVAASAGRAHLRMLEELRDAGILTAEEFAAKRLLIDL